MLTYGLIAGASQSRHQETIPPILIKHLLTKVMETVSKIWNTIALHITVTKIQALHSSI